MMGDIMNGLIVEHVLTRTVRDCAAALDATAGPAPGDPYYPPPPARAYLEQIKTPPERLKIAFTTSSPGSKIHPDCVAAVKKTARLCQELGHDVEEATPPLDLQQIAPAFVTVYAAGLASNIELLKTLMRQEPTRDSLESLTWNVYQKGKEVTAAQYLLAISTLQRITRDLAKFFEKYPVWLTPTLGTPPLTIGAVDLMAENAELTHPTITEFVLVSPIYNITGQPAISVPMHWNDAGLPIGVTLGGKYGDEATLLQLSAQLEKSSPWIERTPPICA